LSPLIKHESPQSSDRGLLHCRVSNNFAFRPIWHSSNNEGG